MNGVNMDSTKLLTEKLSLSRELATLKPEIEHLRTQAAYQQTILSEKLALQRQVSTLEVELETEKRGSKRTIEKTKYKEREAELQQQVDDLQKELARQKREREIARKEAEKEIEMQRRAAEENSSKERESGMQQRLDELRTELSREMREAEKARKDIEKDLEAELRSWKRAAEKKSNGKGGDLVLQQQLEELQNALAQEKRENGRAWKEAERNLSASETRHTVLESKLDQMRTKLVLTKQELKECQTELSKAHAAAVEMSSMQEPNILAKNPRKRAVMEVTDIAIGIPNRVGIRGKKPAIKRGRVDPAILGEKSMFSITPYLNRTISIAPEDTAQNERDETVVDEGVHDRSHTADDQPGDENKEESLANGMSPSAPPKPKARNKHVGRKVTMEKEVLGESSQTLNIEKPVAKKRRAISTLERVMEEAGDENVVCDEAPSSATADIVRSDVSRIAKAGPKKVEEAEPKKKKRKLLGGAKTLFDEEDGEATKRPTKVNLGPPRLLSKGGFAGRGSTMKNSIAAVGQIGGFSPLKKDRRGAGASFLS